MILLCCLISVIILIIIMYKKSKQYDKKNNEFKKTMKIIMSGCVGDGSGDSNGCYCSSDGRWGFGNGVSYDTNLPLEIDKGMKCDYGYSNAIGKGDGNGTGHG